MADDTIQQAESSLLEDLSKPKQYTNDGETVVMPTPAEKIDAIKYARRAGVSIKNAFGCCGAAKITTQGPEKR